MEAISENSYGALSQSYIHFSYHIKSFLLEEGVDDLDGLGVAHDEGVGGVEGDVVTIG